jgi:hypothetical protein
VVCYGHESAGLVRLIYSVPDVICLIQRDPLRVAVPWRRVENH